MIEYWDLYDANRQPLERTIARGEKLADGEYRVCCEVWVIDSDGRFLIIKRHPEKTFGNLWEFPGGGTLAGETTTASAIRELFEETGIEAHEDELKLLATHLYSDYFMDIFVIKKDLSICDIRLNPDEAVDVKWATSSEILRLIDHGEFVYTVGLRFRMYKDLILNPKRTGININMFP